MDSSATEEKVIALQAALDAMKNRTLANSAALAITQEQLDNLAASTNTHYLLYSGTMVFFMQAGFGMLEAGSVRVKNTRNILLKNLLDACIAALIFWSWGFGAAYETGSGKGNPFIGTPGPAMFAGGWVGDDESSSGADYAAWWFQYVFAAAASTIVSGAMAERAQLGAYMVYTVVITGLIYPVIVHWVWDSHGWVSAFNPDAYLGGVVDFAGSGVVHMTGGVAAFWGAKIIGPRTGRFVDGVPVPIPGHSTVLQVLGTFALWMGWYGFNPGSTLGISPDGYAQAAARAAVTTTISAAFAGLTVVGMTYKLDRNWDVGALCNGVLAGLVSITAGCATVYPWAAAVIGVIGGFVYVGGSRLTLRLGVDDPVDACAVHGCCGFWACLATGIFTTPQYAYGAGEGLIYGGTAQLRVQLTTLLAQIAWTSTIIGATFTCLKKANMLRVSVAVESLGMDESKHGGTVYNYDSDFFCKSPKASPKAKGAPNGTHKVAPSPAVKYIAEASPDDPQDAVTDLTQNP